MHSQSKESKPTYNVKSAGRNPHLFTFKVVIATSSMVLSITHKQLAHSKLLIVTVTQMITGPKSHCSCSDSKRTASEAGCACSASSGLWCASGCWCWCRCSSCCTLRKTSGSAYVRALLCEHHVRVSQCQHNNNNNKQKYVPTEQESSIQTVLLMPKLARNHSHPGVERVHCVISA
jgi:hypothetical protein